MPPHLGQARTNVSRPVLFSLSQRVPSFSGLPTYMLIPRPVTVLPPGQGAEMNEVAPIVYTPFSSLGRNMASRLAALANDDPLMEYLRGRDGAAIRAAWNSVASDSAS